MPARALKISLALSESSKVFLDAFFDLMTSIEHADKVMLEEDIAESHRAVVAALRGLKFRTGGDS